MTFWDFLIVLALCVTFAWLWLRLVEETLRLYDIWSQNRKEPQK